MTYIKLKNTYALIFLLGILCSCSGNQPLEARYQAERMYHQADNLLRDTQSLNTTISDEKFAEISDQFIRLVDFCYEQLKKTDSTMNPVEYNEFNYLTYQASTRLSQLYYLNKEYHKCVDISNRLLSEINIPAKEKASIYINLGQSLQSAGNWDSAYAVYENALELFLPPLTSSNEILNSIFNLPLYVFRVVNFINDNQATVYEITKAENYYLNLIHDFPDSKLEIASRANLAKLYDQTGQWEKELAQLNKLTDPQSKSYYTVLLQTADIFGGKLNKSDTALTIYNLIYDQTTDDDRDMRAILLYKKALVQIDLGNYEVARSLLFEIRNKFSDIYDQSPLYQYNFGRSFELQNKWNRAEQEYSLLLDKFKGSSESMMILLYIVDHFRDVKNQSEHKRWFAKAESYLDDLIKRGQGSLLEAQALLYRADLLYRDQQLENSAKILTTIYDKFPESEPGRQALLKSIQLYDNKLNNPQKADSLLAMLKSSLVNTPIESNSEDLFEN